LLRRNIHRLEKGLIMRPRHPIFGEAYIAETVRCYDQAKKTPGFSEAELQWATDVLNEYFAVADDSPVIRKAKTDYERCQDAIATSPSHPKSVFKPYLRGSSPATDISLESLSTLFERRRSVRWYQDEAVPMELIQKTIDAALSAPSACNRQPFRFIVSNIPERASEIAKCAGGTTGYAENVPAIIVVVGDLSAYPKEQDRHLIYIDSSLASMQLMLAAEALGLATCPINWPDIDKAEKRIQRILNLPAHERVVMLISIGYGDPEGGIAYSQKKQGTLITTELDYL
jgi:nitroreductase